MLWSWCHPLSSTALLRTKLCYSFFAIVFGFNVGICVGLFGPKVARGLGRVVGARGTLCRAGIGWGAKGCAPKARRAWHSSPKRRRLKGNDVNPTHEGPARK